MKSREMGSDPWQLINWQPRIQFPRAGTKANNQDPTGRTISGSSATMNTIHLANKLNCFGIKNRRLPVRQDEDDDKDESEVRGAKLTEQLVKNCIKTAA